MRQNFDRQLELLNKDLITMGALCEKAISLAARALARGSEKDAEEVSVLSAEIDQKERDIETMCMKLLLHQQPVASDLRVISSALKMVTDLERIGDNSCDIAEIVTMGNIKTSEDMLGIQDMAEAVKRMVTDSIDAFVKCDVPLAKAVIEYDSVVDDHFNRIKTVLIERISRADADGEYALDLLMTAKYFERIGDHAEGIAKWVLFSITGSKEG